MPPPRIPNTILPQNHLTFDVWNSSSTGHQVADSAQGPAWRDKRREKLTRQFGEGQGDCTLSLSGASDDGRGEWVIDSSASYSSRGKARLGTKGRVGKDAKQMDIRGMFGVSKRGVSARGWEGMEGMRKKMRIDAELISSSIPAEGKEMTGFMGSNMRSISGPMIPSTSMSGSKSKIPSQAESQSLLQSERDAQARTHTHTHALVPTSSSTSTSTSTSTSISPSLQPPIPTQQTLPSTPSTITPSTTSTIAAVIATTSTKPTPQILTNLTIHINGQTTPHISDHKLKHLLITHGADLALHLHRKVTHVIICQPNSGPGRGVGSGGGFAAGKLQREIQRGGWKGIKSVGVEWVLDSIAAGKRLSETRYAVNLRSNQKSVSGYLTASAYSQWTSKSTSIE